VGLDRWGNPLGPSGGFLLLQAPPKGGGWVHLLECQAESASFFSSFPAAAWSYLLPGHITLLGLSYH
jgi:hypothetical protein